MARPTKNTVDYFPHDTNASHISDTLRTLDHQYQNNGYALWFKLLERCGQCEGLVFDTRDRSKWRVFLSDIHFEEPVALEAFALLVELGAIDADLWNKNRVVWVQNFVDNVADVFRGRKDGVVPQKPVITTGNPNGNEFLPMETRCDDSFLHDSTQSKVKYIKVNNTKVNKPACGVVLPVEINADLWDAFLEVRRKKRAPETSSALVLLLNKLVKLKEQGHDPNKLLEESIMRGWTGVFAPNNNGGKNGQNQRKGLPDRETGYTPAPPDPELDALVAAAKKEKTD